MAAVTVRELFGYSFATWRLHLRGETIRSAHDVGRIRVLSVGSLMRRDVRTVLGDTRVSAFRHRRKLTHREPLLKDRKDQSSSSPSSKTRSASIAAEDLITFVRATGHDPRIVAVSTPAVT